MNDAFFALDRDWRFTYVNRQAERLLRRSRARTCSARACGTSSRRRVGTPVPGPLRAAPRTAASRWSSRRQFAPLGRVVRAQRLARAGRAVGLLPGDHRPARVEQERERAYAEREQAVVERERAYAEAEAANTRLVAARRRLDPAGRLAGAAAGARAAGRAGRARARRLGRRRPGRGDRRAAARRGRPRRPRLGRRRPRGARRPGRPGRARRLVALVQALHDRRRAGLGAVVRTGRAEWLPAVADERAARRWRPTATVDAALREPPAPARALTVPLANRGRVLGAVTVAAPAGGAVDRALLADLAGRAAVALDNALLYGAERRTGITLQRSLLPRERAGGGGPAHAPRATCRARPGPSSAATGTRACGSATGCVLAMGDVMGHGMRSAARMGQLRAIVATLALEGHGPAALLAPAGRQRRRAARPRARDAARRRRTTRRRHADRGLRRAPAAAAGAADGPARASSTSSPVRRSAPLPAAYAESIVPLAPGGHARALHRRPGGEPRRVARRRPGAAARRARATSGCRPRRSATTCCAELGRVGGGDDDVALLVLSHRARGPVAGARRVTGTVCLQGGGEFSPGYREMDAALVAAEAGPVVVTALAGAVGREYDTANRNGVRALPRGRRADVVAAPDVRDRPGGRARGAARAPARSSCPAARPSRLLQAAQTDPRRRRAASRRCSPTAAR